MLQDSDLDVLCSQLRTVARSEDFILAIIAAVALSYYATDMQKQQLCAAVCTNTSQDVDVTPIRLGAAILVLLSVTYFYRLSVQALCESPCDRSARHNHLSSLLVLIAAIVRLLDQLQAQ